MATTAERKNSDESVASQSQNDKLAHTNGGTTTRDDVADLGVPMKPGPADAPVGPEDALGEAETRGDYTGRIGPENYRPHSVGLGAEGKVVTTDQRQNPGAQA